MYWFIVHSYTHWTVTFVVQWHAHSPEVSVNIRTAKVVVLYLFTVTCIEIWCVKSLGRIKSSRLRLFFDDVPEKIACSGLLLSERLEQATEKKGMDLWKQMSSKWSFTFFCGIFWLKPVPFRDYSLCSVCILPQPAFYSQSAVCILHLVCILPLVRSLRFTLTANLSYEPVTKCALQHSLFWRYANDLRKTISKHLIMSQLSLARQ